MRCAEGDVEWEMWGGRGLSWEIRGGRGLSREMRGGICEEGDD